MRFAVVACVTGCWTSADRGPPATPTSPSHAAWHETPPVPAKPQPPDAPVIANNVAMQLRTNGPQLIPDLMRPPLARHDQLTGNTIVCGGAAKNDMVAVGQLLVDPARPALQCTAQPSDEHRMTVACIQPASVDAVSLRVVVYAGRIVDVATVVMGSSLGAVDRFWLRTGAPCRP